MTKFIVTILRAINLLNYHWSKFLEKFQPEPSWAKELSPYFKISPRKVIQAYFKKQPVANNLWGKKPRVSLKSIFSFYSETNYFIYRQSNYNRHNSWWEVAWLMSHHRKGRLLEYGAGIGPVTNWLIDKFPGWQYHLVDINCPAFKFSRWRFRGRSNVSFGVVNSLQPPLSDKFDIIICRNVLEHIPNPLTVCREFVRRLKPGGWLLVDFINSPGGENLASSYRERDKTLELLQTRLRPVFKIYSDGKDAGYGLYFK